MIPINNKILILLIISIFFFNISFSFANDLSSYENENNAKANLQVYCNVNPILNNNADSFYQNISNNTDSFCQNTSINTDSHYENSNNNSNNLSTDFKGYASGNDERPSKFSPKTVMKVSLALNKFISKNGYLPDFVIISKYKYSLGEFTYILAKTIENRYKKNNRQIIIKYNVKDPKNPKGQTINGKFSSKNFYKYTMRVSNYIEKYNRAPNNVATSLGKMQYQTIIYSFTKILKESKKNNLPKTLKINIKKSHILNRYAPEYNRLNEISSKILNDKYNGESLYLYLQETKNCEVNDEKIKSLAAKLTKNSKTDLEKATAIFNWVKYNIEYDYYYDTKFGAKETINMKFGNCVDQSHLTIALCRASGIAARYVYGTCTFTSGSRNGHLWVQILIGNTWTVADPSNERNTLGIIDNWIPATYELKEKFAEITF